MNKILMTAVLSSFGAAAHAQSSVTLYGIIDAGVSYVNHSKDASGGSSSLAKYDDGVASASRWGMRSSEDLGDGLKALFVFENGFDSSNGRLGQGLREFGRQAYVGLAKNGVGSFTMGRQYSFSTDILSAYSTGGQTVAGNYAYHINDADQLTASRIDNSVKFTSARFAGFMFGALYGFSNQAGAFAGSLAGSSTGNAGSSRAYSFGLNYAAGPFGIGAAYTDIRYPSPVSIANVSFSNVKDLRSFGVAACYSIGAAAAWVLYTNTRYEPVTGGATRFDAYEVGGTYLFTPALTAGLSYTYMRLGDSQSGHWNQINASLDYALSKRTDIYVLGVYQAASGKNGTTPLQAQIGMSPSYFGTSGSGSEDQLAFRVGIRHKF